jgi:hypothetical protein
MARKKKEADDSIIKETYVIDQFTGIASLLGIKKGGYKVKEINRKGTTAVITYEKTGLLA